MLYMNWSCKINRIWCLKQHILQVNDFAELWRTEANEQFKMKKNMSPVGFKPESFCTESWHPRPLSHADPDKQLCLNFLHDYGIWINRYFTIYVSSSWWLYVYWNCPGQICIYFTNEDITYYCSQNFEETQQTIILINVLSCVITLVMPGT